MNDPRGKASDRARSNGTGTVIRHQRTEISDTGVAYEVIWPVNRVAEKAGAGGPAPSEIERREKAVMAEFAERYRDSLLAQVAELQAEVARIDGAEDVATSLHNIRRIGQDIRGHAGAFGFPLAGEIAALLNDAFDTTGDDKKLVAALRTYVNALTLITRSDIRSRDDSRGRRLFNAFSALAQTLA